MSVVSLRGVDKVTWADIINAGQLEAGSRLVHSIETAIQFNVTRLGQVDNKIIVGSNNVLICKWGDYYFIIYMT